MSSYTGSAGSIGAFEGTTYFASSWWIGISGPAENVWALFSSVSIPQGATITAATLALTVSSSDGTRSNMLGVVLGAAADNTTAGPTTYSAYTGGPRTTASKTFTGNAVSAIDVSAVLSEITSRAGWASGNGLMLYLQDNGSPANTDIKITAASLSVTYTAGGGAATASGSLSLSGAAGARTPATASGSLALAGTASAAAAFTITVVPSGATATVSWPAVGSSYVVERDGAQVAFGVTGTSYTDTPPAGSHTYRVGVLA